MVSGPLGGSLGSWGLLVASVGVDSVRGVLGLAWTVGTQGSEGV